MKIRSGFVSNSSSSSFVIHTSAFDTPEEEKEFLETLERAVIETAKEHGEPIERVAWGEDGGTFYKKGNMIYVQTYYAPDSVQKLYDKYWKKSPENIFDMEY